MALVEGRLREPDLIWPNQALELALDLTIENVGDEDLPGCTPPCSALTLFVAVSEDDVWSSLDDTLLDLDQTQIGSQKT